MTPSSANDFHAFSRLPPELRYNVWRHAAFPRVVTIRSRTAWGLELRSKDFDPYFWYYDSVPAVLHTCSESRRWAPYVRAFRNVVFHHRCGDHCDHGRWGYHLNKSPRYIWVNFDLDTVKLVDNAIYLEKVGSQDMAEVQRLILQYHQVHEFFYDVTLAEMDRFSNLKSLQIHVAYGGIDTWINHIRFIEKEFLKWFGRRPDILLKDLDTGFQLDRGNYLTHRHLAPNSPVRCPHDPPKMFRGHEVPRGFRDGRYFRGGGRIGRPPRYRYY